ncbi:MAG: RsmB/NOP family class I SAM-dependent RNA methyltransferase [Deltaproteobacteria bacterium]|nr:RsmB/NOP family class I SAM-dependent RNA methyltransferase [Deltaproteobacteria bacterium]
MSRYERAFGRYSEVIPDFQDFLAALARPAPDHFRVNTLKTEVEEVVGRLGAEAIRAEPEPWCPFVFRSGGGRSLGATLLHSLGHIYVQSASSAVSALALEPRPGERVLDLCAAPGSKSTLIAQLMSDEGSLVANEPSARRLKSLTNNLERMGITCAVVTGYTGQNLPGKLRFDRALVDAPCSGEGTWRGPEARPKPAEPAFRGYLARQQKALVRRAYDCLEPGGTLVYSTCTYAPEENESVVSWLVGETGARLLPIGLDLAGLPGLRRWEGERYPEEISLARRLYPHRFDSEGFFVARLAKP